MNVNVNQNVENKENNNNFIENIEINENTNEKIDNWKAIATNPWVVDKNLAI